MLDGRAQKSIDSLVVVELYFSLGRVYVDVNMFGIYLQIKEILRLFPLPEQSLEGT